MQINPIPQPTSTPTTIATPLPTPKKKIPWLVIVLVVFLLGATGAFAYQNYQLKQQLNNQPSTLLPSPQLIVSSPEPLNSPKTENDPTINWSVVESKILGIKFKLPSKLGLLEMSGKEEAGEKGTQYCMVYVGSFSFKLIKPVHAGGGACGGGQFTLGATSIDYEAGRMGGFGDLQGYTKENNQYYAKMVLGKKFLIPSELIQEITNNHGIKILKVTGRNEISESFPEGMPLAGTPGKGMIGALINLSNNSRYSGFNLQMELGTNSSEELFDQILSTFQFTN